MFCADGSRFLNVSAEVANPGPLGMPSMALDSRFPAGMTGYLDICV
jgi:hypothetical protein